MVDAPIWLGPWRLTFRPVAAGIPRIDGRAELRARRARLLGADRWWPVMTRRVLGARPRLSARTTGSRALVRATCRRAERVPSGVPCPLSFGPCPVRCRPRWMSSWLRSTMRSVLSVHGLARAGARRGCPMPSSSCGTRRTRSRWRTRRRGAGEDGICHITAYGRPRANFEFTDGASLADPLGILEGAGARGATCRSVAQRRGRGVGRGLSAGGARRRRRTRGFR